MSLVESVREFPPGEREARLRAVCSDSALSEEVLTLIEWEERMKGFLLEPLFGRPPVEDTFGPGSYLGQRFRIVREAGRGGMGIVYEAMDKELEGRVALKCAKPGHSSRLPPEARAAREVSHFNVCKVHDLHKVSTEFGEMDFLSMEFIEGETLSARLASNGPLPEDVACEIALQICAGLAQAHRQGVIHGDIKCSNIILARAPEGGVRAVITDFGLAKLKFAEASQLLGAQGGTFDYMAPELFCGEPAAVASDVYALGVLFHTMLTGHVPERAHPSLARGLVETWNAGSSASTLVLKREIADTDWQRKVEELPSQWKKVVTRCLAPRPGNRFRSAEDISQALTRRATWIGWTATGAGIAAAAATWLLWASNPVSRLEGLVQLTSATELSGGPSLSRDGKTIVYESDRAEPGNLDIWVQQLPGGGATRLTADRAEAQEPSVSPDGRSVAFRSEREGGGVYLVDTAGRNERLLAAGGRTPQFSPDGRLIVYWTGDVNESVPSGRIYIVPAAGSPATRLAADFADARMAAWSDDGRFLLFRGCRAPGQPLRLCSDWWVMSADGSAPIQTGAMTLLRRLQISPRDRQAWHGDKVIFDGAYKDINSLWEIGLSRRDFRVVGHPRQLTSGEGGERGVTVAGDGSIAFYRLSSALHIWRIDHASIPSAASTAKVTGEAAVDVRPYVSRNGYWLIFGRGSRSHKDIWLKDLRSKLEAPSVTSEWDKSSPIVDDSGKTIVYEQREPEASAIWLAAGQSRRKLCTGCGSPTAWLGDGEAFFYSGSKSSSILVMDTSSGMSRVAVDGGDTSVGDADWSPASQYLLFTASPDGSRKQVYAARFPRSASQPVADWIPVTSDSEWSDRPRWSGDGKTVFFLSNRDGFYCVWGQYFDPVTSRPRGLPFAIAHYHNPRISPDRVRRISFAMAASGDSVFLNIGEVAASVWTGKLIDLKLFPLPRIF
jgi:serine/threonine protein kinase/Tol biopolymer transport system component